MSDSQLIIDVKDYVFLAFISDNLLQLFFKADLRKLFKRETTFENNHYFRRPCEFLIRRSFQGYRCESDMPLEKWRVI